MDTTVERDVAVAAAPAIAACGVFELRQYTMVPGQRDTLIALFEREFIETQEATGMCVPGHFRDLDRPDYYVFMRGFPDMDSRRRALETFYTSPVWLANRAAANATLVDSDDVLLLRPTVPFAWRAEPRPPRGATALPVARWSVVLVYLEAPVDDDVRDLLQHDVSLRLAALGTPVQWVLETEYAENTYPRLPIRTGEHVVAILRRHGDGNVPAEVPGDAIAPLRDRLAARAPELIRLAPAARSWMR